MISLATCVPQEQTPLPLASTYLAALEIALVPQPSVFVLDIFELGDLGNVDGAAPAHAQ